MTFLFVYHSFRLSACLREVMKDELKNENKGRQGHGDCVGLFDPK